MQHHSTSEALELGGTKALLFDDHYTQEKRGFAATLHPPCRDVEPVVRADRPWEAGGIVGDSNVTVMADEGRYRMWYVVRDPRPNPSPREIGYSERELADLDEKTRNDLLGDSRYMLCYAESSDGLHWDKPALNIVDHDGSKANNMLLAGRMGATVFKDPTAPPEQRYKLIHGFGPRLPQVFRDGTGPQPPRRIFHAVYGSTSPDGIHWRVHGEPIMDWYTDTTNVAYYDERIGKYVAFVRFNQNLDFDNDQTVVLQRGAEHYRAIGRSESDDFFRFPKPTKIAEPAPRERRPRATGMDYYNSAAMPWPGAHDAYVMFSSNFHHEQDVLAVHLATSRDGVSYERWKQPLIGPGLEGAWDSRSIYMATGMIRVGDELWMYYHGRDHCHGDRGRGQPHSGIGRVRFRADGLVSQQASPGGARLLTRPLRVTGDRLALNMDASAGGRIKVEICNEHAAPLPGFSADDADWLWYNDLARPVTWRGGGDITALCGRVVRLRFIAKAARLYGFEFRDNAG